MHVCTQERSERSMGKRDCVARRQTITFLFWFSLSSPGHSMPAFFAKKPLSPQSLLKECTVCVLKTLRHFYKRVIPSTSKRTRGFKKRIALRMILFNILNTVFLKRCNYSAAAHLHKHKTIVKRGKVNATKKQSNKNHKKK